MTTQCYDAHNSFYSQLASSRDAQGIAFSFYQHCISYEGIHTCLYDTKANILWLVDLLKGCSAKIKATWLGDLIRDTVQI